MSVLYSDDIVPAAAMAANILRPGCSFTSLLQTVHHTVTVARLLLFLLLQYLLQSCSREGGGEGTMEDMCYERLRVEACVD
jgi:hypothetical protein